MTITEPTEQERQRLAPKRGLAPIVRGYLVSDVEIRAQAGESTLIDFVGHASVYDKGYDMYGGPDKGGWTEFVDGGAGKKTLSENPDVAFLVNHEGLTLARTKAGTLKLSEDKIGLAVAATLDTRVSTVNDIAILMDAGALDEMSFAFRITKQKWLDADGEEVPWWDLSGIERHISEYNLHRGDVSIVNQGANPYTDAKMRSLTELLRDATAQPDDLDEEELRQAVAYLEELLNRDATDADPAMLVTINLAQRRQFVAKHDFL